MHLSEVKILFVFVFVNLLRGMLGTHKIVVVIDVGVIVDVDVGVIVGVICC